MFVDSAKLIALEKYTLKTILHVHAFSAMGPTVVSSAQKAIEGMQGRTNGVVLDFNMTFDVQLDARGGKDSKPRRTDIGAIVTISSNEVADASYQLTICEDNTLPCPILRKLHFDFAHPAHGSRTDVKPPYHVQLAGKLSPHQLAASYSESDVKPLYPWCEKPRLLSLPTTLGLVIHWFLLEFRSYPPAADVLKTNEWRAHIRKLESEFLIPTLAGLHKELVKGNKHTCGAIESCLYS